MYSRSILFDLSNLFFEYKHKHGQADINVSFKPFPIKKNHTIKGPKKLRSSYQICMSMYDIKYTRDHWSYNTNYINFRKNWGFSYIHKHAYAVLIYMRTHVQIRHTYVTCTIYMHVVYVCTRGLKTNQKQFYAQLGSFSSSHI